MENINGFDCFRLFYDDAGKPTAANQLAALNERAATATDIILIAHGFRNDENDATRLYTDFLKNFRTHVGSAQFAGTLPGRNWAVGLVFWPSKSFSESSGDGAVQSADSSAEERAEKEMARAQLIELRDTIATEAQKPRIDQAIALLDQVKDSAEAQNQLVTEVLSLLEGAEDEGDGLEEVRAASGSDLLKKLGGGPLNPVAPDVDAGEGGAGGLGPVVVTDEEGATQGIGGMLGSVFGGIGKFLNMTTWYVMKNRSGVVGMAGVAAAVRTLKAAHPAIKVHLVGHSLGGRLMAGCCKSLTNAPMVQPHTTTLLEAAFSHYGFSPNNGRGKVGFFRRVITTGVVKGPLLATFSAQDNVVGLVYATASRLAGDNVEAIGDANDQFGGIGRNGSQMTPESTFETLHDAGKPYAPFALGKVVNLDGSGGRIKDHGDITNLDVTYAFATSVASV